MYKAKLSSIADYVSDKVPMASLNKANYIGVDNMLPNYKGITQADYLPNEGNATRFMPGDILLGNIRPYFKKIWLATFEGGCSPDVLVIRPAKEVTSEYIYAALATDHFFAFNMSGAKGSKMPRGDKNHIMSYPVPLFTTQERIGAFVRSINTRIENNNAICAELEAMAKLLYDYWFVQFDFPDENGKPYKSSGGKMFWSEEIKREIPEGWEVKTIGDISRMVNDSITPNKSSMYHHFSIPAFDDTHMPVYEPGASIDSNKYCVNDDCILVSKLNPQFKRIWVISKAPENSICSTEYIPFVSTNETKEYLYSTFNSDAFYTFMVNSSSSSTGSRKRMPPEMCPRFKIPYPKNGSVVIQYCNAVKPMLDRANSMYSENQELASLRDFLLPLLMNGQVTFKEADCH